MVLAIGLLVDDAIVVIENVERLIRRKGSARRKPRRKSMDQISGALVAIATVLAACVPADGLSSADRPV